MRAVFFLTGAYQGYRYSPAKKQVASWRVHASVFFENERRLHPRKRRRKHMFFYYRRPLIVKCGTAFLYAANITHESTWPYAAQDAFDRVAAQVTPTERSGVPIMIVSSGAVKEGQRRFVSAVSAPGRLSREVYAGIGAPHLYKRWSYAFELQGRSVAQVLVTVANLNHNGERRSIASAIATCHVNGIIPIINENDIVADAEQSIGDNDRLARMIAELVYAGAVLFLTHRGGVYERNPACNPHVRQYREIDAREALTNPYLTDGIATKLFEAVQCFAMGMRVAIAGAESDTIRKFAAGEAVGTIIGNAVQFY